MLTDLDIITLKGVAAARTHLAAIETTLMGIEGDIAPQTDSPILGMVDLHFLDLCHVQGHLSGLDPVRLQNLAGQDAADALRGYQGSFLRMREAYGIVSGSDRIAPARDALHWSLRGIASKARGHLLVYATRTAALAVPTDDDVRRATQRIVHAARNAKPPFASPVPKVRPAMTREDTARRARIALGYAFGGVGGVILKMQMPPHTHIGMLALMHLSSVVEEVRTRADALAYRCAPEDSVFADHTQGIADSLNTLFHHLEDAIVRRNIPPEAVKPLTDEMVPTWTRIREAIRQIEALTAPGEGARAN